MNIVQLKTMLREIITETDLPTCVVGHRGVGKTAAIVQVVKEIDFKSGSRPCAPRTSFQSR